MHKSTQIYTNLHKSTQSHKMYTNLDTSTQMYTNRFRLTHLEMLGSMLAWWQFSCTISNSTARWPGGWQCTHLRCCHTETHLLHRDRKVRRHSKRDCHHVLTILNSPTGHPDMMGTKAHTKNLGSDDQESRCARGKQGRRNTQIR